MEPPCLEIFTVYLGIDLPGTDKERQARIRHGVLD